MGVVQKQGNLAAQETQHDFIFLRASTYSRKASSMDQAIGESSKVAVWGLTLQRSGAKCK